MIELRPFAKLGGADHGWLKAKHHFSFGSHYDPDNMGHGALRVWNDDEIAANSGFPPHPHRDMEIITYVREGAITHQDSLGNKGRTEAGDVHPTFWLPSEGLAEKARNDRVPYDLWESQGFLQTTPGRAIEYEFVAEHLRGVFDRCNVRAIAFDRYNMKFLKPWLEKAGFSDEELERFIEFGQGFVSMSPALRETESLLLGNKLRHGKHPVLTMCASNAVTITDSTGNRKLAKQK